MKIAVACGGTGGHIYPGLSTAKVLRSRGHDVVLWLSGRDIESVTAGDWEGRVISVKARGFSSGISFSAVSTAVSIIRAFFECRRIMKKERPDAVLGMGSYASFGPVASAKSLGIPVVLHEANVVPGLAVSAMAGFADAVCVTFREASEYLKKAKRIVVTGMPVKRMDKDAANASRKPGVFTVLVMGGSQGAHRLNEISVQAMLGLKQEKRGLRVIHLTGRADEALVRKAYEDAGLDHEVYGYLKEIGRAYASSDLAISRSGASACMELAACGLPALLVPLPTSRRNHQLMNANVMKAAGGADVIEEKDLSAERLAEYIGGCMRNKDKMESMKNGMKSAAVSDAAEKLADFVEKTAGGLNNANL